MHTNATIRDKSELHEKGKALLAAAYDFWKAHAQAFGMQAVVWLKDCDGKVVVFTRSEYTDTIMKNIRPVMDEVPMLLPEDIANPDQEAV